MNKLKAVRTITLTILIGVLISCTKNENNEYKLSDLSESEKVDLVKINFLSEFGGIELERYTICTLETTKFEFCELDTSLNIQLEHIQGYYKINLDGIYSINCSKALNVYNNRFIRYDNHQSTGKAELNSISQEFDLQTSVTIAGNSQDGVYVTSCNTIRNLSYTSQKHVNFRGSINFVSNLCEFDYNNCTLTDKTAYSFNLRLKNKKTAIDELNFDGMIKLIDNKWTLMSSEGIIAALE